MHNEAGIDPLCAYHGPMVEHAFAAGKACAALRTPRPAGQNDRPVRMAARHARTMEHEATSTDELEPRERQRDVPPCTPADTPPLAHPATLGSSSAHAGAADATAA